MIWQAQWIKPDKHTGDAAPVFMKQFATKGTVDKAILSITALGVYEAKLNGERIGDFVLAPGWTTYIKRLQYQQYDVSRQLRAQNQLQVIVAKGWYRSKMCGRMLDELQKMPCGLIAQLDITYLDGQKETIITDDSWRVSESEIRFAEIYDGEICDGRLTPSFEGHAEIFEGPWHTLIPQEGEKIIEHEHLAPARIFTTPKGEKVIDFGQNIAGYVEIRTDAEAGDMVRLSHGEVLDQSGNFYNENYVGAKANYIYFCHAGRQTYHPRFTFYGFRYVKVEAFPGGIENIHEDQFTAIAVHSDIRQTGHICCSNPSLNQFFSNVLWSQKSNFLDIPTDCPQRDERLGWTGDAQIFIRTAAYNFSVEKFFEKWLGCMRADQGADGYIGHMIPDTWHFEGARAGWADAAIICPWELYMAYGNAKVLKQQFECMKKYIDYIDFHTKEKDLWIGCEQYGDWYAPDRAEGADSGPSNRDLIASAYYAYSTKLFVKAGKIIGEDMADYEALHHRIVKAFRKKFPRCSTQTECAIAVCFGLAEDQQAVADQLAEMVQKEGLRLTTGFLGTPCLLYALSTYGHADIAYSLLLQEEYPSWLYAVKHGATTTWEHWNGIKPDGSFWKSSENSFNHYAYGAVMDWVYRVAGGISPMEEAPGYKKVRIAPTPDARLDWLHVSLDTKHGTIRSEWKKQQTLWRYEITVPTEAEIIIAGKVHYVKPGTHYFYSAVN